MKTKPIIRAFGPLRVGSIPIESSTIISIDMHGRTECLISNTNGKGIERIAKQLERAAKYLRSLKS